MNQLLKGHYLSIFYHQINILSPYIPLQVNEKEGLTPNCEQCLNWIICLQIEFYRTIEPLFCVDILPIAHGKIGSLVSGILKFESMTMCTNDFVFMDLHIMPIMLVISWTQKTFHWPAVSPSSVYCLYFGDTALNFAGNCKFNWYFDLIFWLK